MFSRWPGQQIGNKGPCVGKETAAAAARRQVWGADDAERKAPDRAGSDPNSETGSGEGADW